MVSGLGLITKAVGQSKELHVAVASQHVAWSSSSQTSLEQSSSAAFNLRTVLIPHAAVAHVFNLPQQSVVAVSSQAASAHINSAALLKWM
jgi:hypothetical protein